MKFATRLLLMGLVVMVFSMGVSRIFALSEDGGIQKLAQWYLTEMRRAEALNQRQLEQAEVMKIKKVAVEEFLAGSLTLGETAKQFGDADAIVQDDSDGLVAPYLAPKTTRELCEQVEIWTRISLRNEGYAHYDAEEVLCRLQAEMNELFPTETLVD